MENCKVGYNVDCISSIMPSSWTSSPDYDTGWITGLYDTAKESLRSIFGNYDEFYLKDDDLLNFDHLDFNTFVEDSTGPIVYLSVWAAVTLVFIILGLCWCCCQKCVCCCKSSFTDKEDEDYLESADPHYQLRPYSQRNSGNKSKTGAIILSVLMAIWLLGFLAAIIHAFASNQKAQETFDDINGDIKNAFDDIISYIKATIEQMRYTLIDGTEILNTNVNTILQECGTACDLDVGKTGQAAKDVDLLMARISTIPAAARSIEVLNANKSLESLKTTLDIMRQSRKPIADYVDDAMAKTQNEVKKNFEDYEDALKEVQKDAEEANERVDKDFDDIMENVYDGTYWGIMLFNLLFVLIFILVLIGTVLATFSRGRRLKIAGYLSYRVSIVIMMIILVFVVTIMLSAFTLAGIASVIICPKIRALEDGATITPTTTPPSSVPTSGPGPGPGLSYDVPTYGAVIQACKNDQSAYNAFQLEQIYNVDKFDQLSDPIEDIINKIPVIPRRFETDLEHQLRSVEYDMAKLTPFNTETNNFTSLTDTLRSDVTTILKDLAVQQAATDFLIEMKDEVDKYEKFLKEGMRDKVGKCWPLYNAVDSTLNTFCVKVVAPVASLWFILQFIPPIFLLIFFTALAFERFHF